MRSNKSTKYVYNAMACDEKIFVQRKKKISLKLLFGESLFEFIVVRYNCKLYKNTQRNKKIKVDMIV